MDSISLKSRTSSIGEAESKKGLKKLKGLNKKVGSSSESIDKKGDKGGSKEASKEGKTKLSGTAKVYELILMHLFLVFLFVF